MHADDYPLPPSPPGRGMYRLAAPHGFIAFQVIDRAGEEFAQIRISRRAFQPELMLLFWNLLRAYDPRPKRVRFPKLRTR